MPDYPIREVRAAYASKHRSIMTRCEQVLIESCNAELRVAQQFCSLAEQQLERQDFGRARGLIENAEKAIAVAGKYSRNPEQRRAELSHLSDRVARLLQGIRERS